MNLLATPLLLLFFAVPSCMMAESRRDLPEAIPISYGVDTLVDLAVGLWGIPLPTDFDGDGVNDMLVSCPDRPYKGIWYFRNIGTNRNPLFERAIRICDIGPNNIRVSSWGGEQFVLFKDTLYEDFFHSFFEHPIPLSYEGDSLESSYHRSRSNMWNFVDWNGDGGKDILVGIDTWEDYGWDNAFDEDGNWTRGPLHGYVHLLKDMGDRYVNQGRVEAGGRPIDTYGAPCPCFADFDGDGLPDLICGEFVDGLTWYRNIGTNDQPRFSAGCPLENESGEIRFHVQMIVPVAFDWDGDGNMDLVVGDEDGTIYWLRNTGKTYNEMPLFENPAPFRQMADLLKFGALSTPCSYDWNFDGEEDLVCGNSAGEIALFRNLGGGKAWAGPELFTVEGKPFRIMAGDNGSIQGPAERKWGYTVLSVADWDGDGRPDIIFNSIWGKVEWMRGLGGTELSHPQPILVSWEGGPLKVAWNWWMPEEGSLATQWRTTPVAIDWNGDGRCDLIVLDQEGWLAYFERLPDGHLAPGKRIFQGTNGSLYDNKKGIIDPTPGPLRLNAEEAGASGRRKICFADWDQDGNLDLIVDGPAAVWWQGRPGDDGNYLLTYKGNLSQTRLEGHTTCPTPVDWDHDGIPDLVVGAEDGHFYLIKNAILPDKR